MNMKKIIAVIIGLSFLFPVFSYANNNVVNDCSVYVKSIKLDNGNYRFRIVDVAGNNNNGSNDWSFTAKDKDTAQLLNFAYMLRHKICINYTYYADYWQITNVELAG
ncbi:hypothetical protein M983_2991 [Proteus myxofaciens ATCC 19692]|uniref:Uncharacterized protein n=2 Tax=Proteus myxofaciens TaxID=184072 RepID=A0A198FCF3_9GAMM|nr:hypothetical protein M983_2991 [Proteus myxofaciens ATCC 19692]